MRSFLGIAVATALVAGVACGGSTFTTGGSDAGTDGRGGSGSSSGSASSSGGGSGGSGGSSGAGSSSGSGSSSGGGSSPCPASPPASNMACMPNGAVCEYGTSPDPGCDQLFECLNSSWVSGGPGALPCSVGTCPAHYVDVPQGQVCSSEGLDCAYAEGQCDCSSGSLGGQGTMPTWHCFRPQGCPEPRPRLGSGCTQEGLSCDYGACTGGLAETCMGGFWHWTQTPCPG